MLRRIFLSGQLYFWIIWLLLLVIYIETVRKTDSAGSALLVLVLLMVLYFAEGMEIAVATLADKQAEQLGSLRAQRALTHIKKDAEWFFAQRQVFVVTIVTFMSLMTNFETVYLPFYGALNNVVVPLPFTSIAIPVNVPFVFTLIFTSFTILWWCQVFPKRLAIRNSEIFLDQSAMLMGPIKGIGKVNLPGPADQLVWFASKYTKYQKLSALRPSRDYYHDTAVMLYGFAIDRSETTITIEANGSATVHQRVLLLFIHGGRTSASGSLETDSVFTTLPKIDMLSLHSAPVPEKFDAFRNELDAIFEGRQAGAFTKQDITKLIAIPTYSPPAPGANLKLIEWKVQWGPPLPDRLRALTPNSKQSPILAALVYEVQTDFAQGAFRNDDSFVWQVEMPGRRVTLKVCAASNNPTNFQITQCEVVAQRQQIPFEDETRRVREVIEKAGISNELDLPHPMQGMNYTISWKGWPTSTTGNVPTLPANPSSSPANSASKENPSAP